MHPTVRLRTQRALEGVGALTVLVLVILVLLPVSAWADAAARTEEFAPAAPPPGQAGQYAGVVTLLALAGLLVFGGRRFVRAWSRRA